MLELPDNNFKATIIKILQQTTIFFKRDKNIEKLNIKNIKMPKTSDWKKILQQAITNSLKTKEKIGNLNKEIEFIKNNLM